jgi:hypothetical protein
MKVFISWSGDLSHRVALTLRDWLPDVLQAVEPYVSSEDIRKGNRWSVDVAEELAESSHGIICLTRQNLDAPWIHFEAGALSKVVATSSLWTLLIDLGPTEVQGPLAQFQHTAFERDDFRRLVATINEQLGDARLSDGRLERVFDKFWPELADKVDEAQRSSPLRTPRPDRSEKAILEEVLDLSRSLARAVSVMTASEGEPHARPMDNFRTTMTIVPGQDEDLIDTLRKRIRVDDELRNYGIVATGGGGPSSLDGVMISTEVWVQSHRPLPRKRMLQLAVEAGVETIDVIYRRIVFQDTGKTVHGSAPDHA